MPRCLSRTEAAHYCGVSPQTLRKHGPAPIRIGRAAVYDIKTIDRWLDELSGIAPTPETVNAAELAMLEAL